MSVVTGSRYLVGFVGDWYAETTWLDEKVQVFRLGDDIIGGGP